MSYIRNINGYKCKGSRLTHFWETLHCRYVNISYMALSVNSLGLQTTPNINCSISSKGYRPYNIYELTWKILFPNTYVNKWVFYIHLFWKVHHCNNNWIKLIPIYINKEVPFEIKLLLFKIDEFLCKNILHPISSVKLYTCYIRKYKVLYAILATFLNFFSLKYLMYKAVVTFYNDNYFTSSFYTYHANT